MLKNILLIFVAYKALQYFNSKEDPAPQTTQPASQLPTQDQLRDLAISKGTQIFNDNVIPFVKGKLQ